MPRWSPKMTLGVFLCFLVLCSAFSFAEPKEKDICEAMRKSTDFMMNEVSYRGGFLWRYSEDLSKQWGEVPARKTQIWVQGATKEVGQMFLDAYVITGDQYYLEKTKEVANALIWGQYPSGGWHYLIDFDMTGIQKWYDDVASRCWGWEEHYHFYNNCTFDDNTTQGTTRFLMNVYMETLDPSYRAPLIKALDFILEAQFPNGAWPQRFPLKYDFVKDGVPDYTSHYTYNDGVISNSVYLLYDAWEQLGNEEYLKAALRGMDFHIISQLGSPQAGWANAYSHDMKPAQERTYEPAGLNTTRTTSNIRTLENFYKITGDRRYLQPIPAALEWLDSAIINDDSSKKYTYKNRSMRYSHALFYEVGTNRPIYTHTEGTNIDNGRFYQSYEISETTENGYYDLDSFRKEFERVSALSPQEARAEYEQEKIARKRNRLPAVTAEDIESIISSMDNRGAWVIDVTLPNYVNPHLEGTVIRGIQTGTYINNMYKFLSLLRQMNQKKK
ncbi:pectate lyase [Candidatus Omnitrophota bacterium]